MIRLFLADTAHLPDPREDLSLCSRLTEERVEKALRPAKLTDRKLQLGAGLLLSEILPRYGARAEEIFYGANGQPLHEKVKFSLSHSGEKVALALSTEGEVGCDIERIREVPERIIKRLPAGEREALMRLSGEERRKSFFRLWTMRESYLKMTGEGLSGFKKIEIGDGILREGEKIACCFREFCADGYAVSVCSEGEFVLERELVALG